MIKTIHVCQDVEGALLNWSRQDWCIIARENKLTIKELKRQMIQYIREGKRVIPMHEKCEGFDYQTGCPGHIKDEKETI